jgi:hypothetical protein
MNRHTFFIFTALLLKSLAILPWECRTKGKQGRLDTGLPETLSGWGSHVILVTASPQ